MRIIDYIRLAIAIIFIGLIIGLSTVVNQNRKLKEDYSIAVGNEKILLQSNQDLNKNLGVLQLRVDQLGYFNDSLLHKMDSVRKELKIRDGQLHYMQCLLSEAEKKDSIVFVKDTIFQPMVHVDTTLMSKWYTLNLKLDYPNSVVVNPKFVSEQYVIIHSNRETVDPPKKFFLCRWFQKRHRVVRVEIVEENPYIVHKNSKFVKILDK